MHIYYNTCEVRKYSRKIQTFTIKKAYNASLNQAFGKETFFIFNNNIVRYLKTKWRFS